MTKNLFKLMLLALVAMLALSGCNMIKIDQTMDDAKVVAEYNGGTITKGEASKEYNDMMAFYTSEGLAEAYKDKEAQKGLKQDVLDYMVRDRIYEAKAKELGLDTIPEEKRQELIQEAVDEYNGIVDQYSMYLRTEGQTDEEARAASVAYLKNNSGIDEQVYANFALADYKDQQIFDKVTEGVELSDEDLKAAYDAAVENDKTNYTATPASFGNAMTNGDTAYWVPEGYRTVKHILVKTPADYETKMDELDSQLGEVEMAIDDILNPEDTTDEELVDETEHYEGDGHDHSEDEGVVESASVTPEEGGVPGTETALGDAPVAAASDEAAVSVEPVDATEELPLEIEAPDGMEVSVVPVDENAPEATPAPDYSAMSLDELNAIKADLDAQIAALKTEIQAALQPKYDEIKAKLDAGESFDSLIEQYGEDPGMTTEPTKSAGYYVSAASDNWDPPFKDGAMALAKVGDVTGPVMGMYGMHIIRYESDVTPGAVDFELVKESLREKALADKKQIAYDEAEDSWYTDANVKLYPERL